MISFNSHVEALIKESDEFEAKLYDWAKQGSSSPQRAIDKIRRVPSYELPDRYAATRDDVVKVALIRKEAEDVIQRIKKEAMSRPWDTSLDNTKKS